MSVPSKDKIVVPLPLNLGKYLQCAISESEGNSCLFGELPAWTWGVSVPLDGTGTAIFPRLFPPQIIELIHACRKLGRL